MSQPRGIFDRNDEGKKPDQWYCPKCRTYYGFEYTANQHQVETGHQVIAVWNPIEREGEHG